MYRIQHMNNEVIFKNGSQVQIYDNNMSKECVTCRMYMNIIQVHCIGINDIISSIMHDTDDDDTDDDDTDDDDNANDTDDDTAGDGIADDDNTNDTEDGTADDGGADDSTADDTGDDSDYDARDDRGDVNDVDSDIRGGVVADDLFDHRSDDNYDARGDF